MSEVQEIFRHHTADGTGAAQRRASVRGTVRLLLGQPGFSTMWWKLPKYYKSTSEILTFQKVNEIKYRSMIVIIFDNLLASKCSL